MADSNAAYVLTEERPPYLCNDVKSRLQYARSHKTHERKSTALREATELQRLAHKTAMALEADLDSATDHKARKSVSVALRQAMAAYESASELVRIARNKPLPGSLRPESPVKKQRKQPVSTFQEIAPASAPSLPAPSGTDVSSKP